ncbi:MAG: triphosphoribosyl-dephospho-CoA synthase [Promethearchaeota archaeon]
MRELMKSINSYIKENPIFLRLAQSAVLASIMEVTAYPKPGNVTQFQSGRDATLSHFLVSSCALFPTYLEAVIRGKECVEADRSLSNLGIGMLVRRGIEQTQSWGISTNTNLGIILLTIPLLAGAAILKAENSSLSYDPQRMTEILSKIVKSSSNNDAINIVHAIQLANPGGLGKVSRFDINQPLVENEIKMAGINLFDLFSSCTEMDLICQEYTTGFKLILFETVPKLEEFLKQTCLEKATSLLFLSLLKEKLDSLIGRKFGTSIAKEIRDRAVELFAPKVTIEFLKNPQILQFDKELREKGYNPGTFADIVAATLFCYFYKNLSLDGINVPLCEPSKNAGRLVLF